ncbi:Crp/Fnr family transcriptional regulator [Olivibacter sitiensis]|uniref:Crp/Fnr family transcriptional regulator n=1 Tax=Olivibacter sitiensis TaxID=376470 RepID=UPI0004001099|nr:Crp/Fnr family transcriptional regulator [Olivibacter sitiensis]
MIRKDDSDKFAGINANVQKCGIFSDKELQFFNNLLQYKEVPKKTFLLHQGEICRFEAYVVKGCVRVYFIDAQGAELTLYFAVEDWWVSDIASFQEHKPSTLFIETLEDSELLLLTLETKELLLKEIPLFERVFRLMVQRNLANLQERLFQTVTTSAVEKYLNFLERYPNIPNRVAQHYIASYLGFTPEFLSKVRRRLYK